MNHSYTFETLFVWKESKDLFVVLYKIFTKPDFKRLFFQGSNPKSLSLNIQ